MFNIELDDIKIPSECPALGIPLFKSPTRGPCPNSPTLDRIVPELGYTKGNIRVISAKANWCKSDLTVGQLLQLANYFHKQLGENS